MAVSSDLTKGILTGSGTQDTVYTSTNDPEWAGVLFRNYSGGAVNLKIFLLDTTTASCIFDNDLATKESVFVHTKLGNGDFIKAEAGAATSISWFVEKDALS